MRKKNNLLSFQFYLVLLKEAGAEIYSAAVDRFQFYLVLLKAVKCFVICI